MGKKIHPQVRQRIEREILSTKIDGRTALGRARREFRNDLLTEVGDEKALPSHRALVDLCVQTKLLCDAIDLYLLGLGSGIVNRKRRQAYPILEQRRQLADSLTSQLAKVSEARQLHDIERRLELLEDARDV